MMLDIQNLWKSYAGFQVLRGVNLHLEKGDVYGLVGKNGAGKTTLMNIVSRQLPYDGGYINLKNVPLASSPDRVAYILDIPAIYNYMTAYEYLEFVACGSGDSREKIRDRSDELLRLVGLEGEGNRKFKQYSRGMQQRFGIAAGIYSDPELILMDEPCSALDPQGRYEVNTIIRRLAAEGKTILLSTHILSDVEKVCSKIGLLSGGQLSFEGTITDLFRKYAQPVFEIHSEDNARLAGLLTGGYILDKSPLADGGVSVTIDDTGENEKKLFRDVAASGLAIESFGRKKVSLEEIFLEENSK